MHGITAVATLAVLWLVKWGWLFAFGLVIKSPADAAAKWGTRSSAAQATYTAGVAATQKDQATLAANAEPQWAQAVAAAAAAHKFSARILKAGTAKWKAGVAALGGQRYQQGVTAPNAQANYTAGVTPIFAALASLQLPARNVKGSNNNLVDLVVNAEMAAAKART